MRLEIEGKQAGFWRLCPKQPSIIFKMQRIKMTVDFERHIYPEADLNRLVIAFAGGTQNVYQFKNTLASLRVNHILMRDSTQHYYGNGVRGIGDRRAVINYIQTLRDGSWTADGERYVITVGVSSGAYAALLYGQLCPVDEVIVISPLTGRELDDFDPKWHQQIYDPSMPDLDDLRKYFRDGPIPKVRAFISDGQPTCALDHQMCTRVNITDITLIPGYEHGELARLGMRDKGMFAELFQPTVEPTEAELAEIRAMAERKVNDGDRLLPKG